MPRTKEENQRIKAERRSAILEVSLPIFAEKGLAGAKISDVAKVLGVSYGLIYSYFPSKESIFIELINGYINAGQEIIDEIEKQDLSPLEKIVKVFDLLLDESDDGPQGALLFRLLQQLNFYPQLWEELVIDNYFDDPVYRYISKMVEQGQEQGLFSGGNSKAMSIVLGMVAMGINMNGEGLADSAVSPEDIREIIWKILA